MSIEINFAIALVLQYYALWLAKNSRTTNMKYNHWIVCLCFDWPELWFWCYDTQVKTALINGTSMIVSTEFHCSIGYKVSCVHIWLWPNMNTSRRNFYKNFNCVGWRNVLSSRRKLYAIVKKLLFCSLVCAIIPKQTILKAISWSLAPTCVWRSNGEKLAPACEQIWAWSKWSQVNAKYRNYTQVLAKRSRKLPSLLVSLKSFFTCEMKPLRFLLAWWNRFTKRAQNCPFMSFKPPNFLSLSSTPSVFSNTDGISSSSSHARKNEEKNQCRGNVICKLIYHLFLKTRCNTRIIYLPMYLIHSISINIQANFII